MTAASATVMGAGSKYLRPYLPDIPEDGKSPCSVQSVHMIFATDFPLPQGDK
jgi:hypothetical protein